CCGVGSLPCSLFLFFFSSRRRHTRFSRDWSSDVCSSDLAKTAYGHLKNAQGAHFDDKLLADTHVLLVTGIANPKPMASYLTQRVKNVKHLRYNDHHHFTQREFTEISNTFRKIGHEQKIIVT